jgi:hypothetical protein
MGQAHLPPQEIEICELNFRFGSIIVVRSGGCSRPEAARDSYKQLALNGFLYFAQIEGQRKF